MNTDSTESYEIEKPTLLVADDSKTMRRAIVRLLNNEMNVLEADDGDTAWEIICNNHDIQVVFADLMMPRMNGFVLLRQMRESIHERIRQLPVIIMTGHEDDEEMCRQAMVLGATDFITKPFDSVQLRTRANAHIRSGDTQRKLMEASIVIEQQTTIDPLTGLPNFNYFHEHGEVLLSFAMRHGADLSVLRIDIDDYDGMVKQRGRQIADRVLINIGKLISHCVRKEDTVAHIAPGKFAVLMMDAGAHGASEIAGRIHALMRKTSYRLGEARFNMTASLGLVTSELAKHSSFDEVIKLAEAQVLKAISTGGDHVVLNDTSKSSSSNEPPASIETEQALSIEQAILLLRAGDHQVIDNQIETLMHRLLPLLEFANQKLKLNFDSGLQRLKSSDKDNTLVSQTEDS